MKKALLMMGVIGLFLVTGTVYANSYYECDGNGIRNCMQSASHAYDLVDHHRQFDEDEYYPCGMPNCPLAYEHDHENEYYHHYGRNEGYGHRYGHGNHHR